MGNAPEKFDLATVRDTKVRTNVKELNEPEKQKTPSNAKLKESVTQMKSTAEGKKSPTAKRGLTSTKPKKSSPIKRKESIAKRKISIVEQKEVAKKVKSPTRKLNETGLKQKKSTAKQVKSEAAQKRKKEAKDNSQISLNSSLSTDWGTHDVKANSSDDPVFHRMYLDFATQREPSRGNLGKAERPPVLPEYSGSGSDADASYRPRWAAHKFETCRLAHAVLHETEVPHQATAEASQEVGAQSSQASKTQSRAASNSQKLRTISSSSSRSRLKNSSSALEHAEAQSPRSYRKQLEIIRPNKCAMVSIRPVAADPQLSKSSPGPISVQSGPTPDGSSRYRLSVPNS